MWVLVVRWFEWNIIFMILEKGVFSLFLNALRIICWFFEIVISCCLTCFNVIEWAAFFTRLILFTPEGIIFASSITDWISCVVVADWIFCIKAWACASCVAEVLRVALSSMWLNWRFFSDFEVSCWRTFELFILISFSFMFEVDISSMSESNPDSDYISMIVENWSIFDVSMSRSIIDSQSLTMTSIDCFRFCMISFSAVCAKIWWLFWVVSALFCWWTISWFSTWFRSFWSNISFSLSKFWFQLSKF